MARLKRICPPGIPQHIVQRGNNRQVCFASEEDFTVHAHWLIESSEKYGVAIHAWVFMTNHVHLLATPREQGSLSRMMQRVGRYGNIWNIWGQSKNYRVISLAIFGVRYRLEDQA